MRLWRRLLVGFRFGRRRRWRREGGLGVVLFRKVRTFISCRCGGGGISGLSSCAVCCGSAGAGSGLGGSGVAIGVGGVRSGASSIGVGVSGVGTGWASVICGPGATSCGGAGGATARGARSIVTAGGGASGVAPVEGRPSRGEMDRSHNDRRRAPAKRSKRRLSSRRPAISALRHGRGASFIGPGAGAPAALGPVAPFDWPVSSSPTNAIFR
jgi:hypothetical protein